MNKELKENIERYIQKRVKKWRTWIYV